MKHRRPRVHASVTGEWSIVPNGWKADIARPPLNHLPALVLTAGPNVGLARSDAMPHDADYYRARAIEERGRAETADRIYLARIHRELAEQLDRRADECEGAAEQFDELAERASQLIKARER